jgi:DNA-binding CsgD family transcriptional regulator
MSGQENLGEDELNKELKAALDALNDVPSLKSNVVGDSSNDNGNGFVDGAEIIRERTAELMDVNTDRRFNPPGQIAKASDIAKLRDHQQEIVRLLATGMKPKTIAQMLRLHPQTVVNIRNSDLGQAMLRMLHGERNVTITKTAERIDALAPRAAEIFEEIMTDDQADASLQYRVAKDTLKASGIMVEKHINIQKHSYLDEEEINSLKSNFKKDFGSNIEEVEFTTINEEDKEE